MYDSLLVINTNLHPILHRFQVIADYWSNFRYSKKGVPHFNALVGGVIPCQYRHNELSLKTRFFGLHFRCRKCLRIFNHFYVIRPESY